MPFKSSWWCPALGAVLALTAAAGDLAHAQSAPTASPVALDATHFALIRGDRVTIYEVDPKRGYDIHVVSSALLDENGQIIGQFRPEGRPSAGPSRAPAAPAPAPAPRQPAPVPSPPADKPTYSAAGRRPPPVLSRASIRPSRHDRAPRLRMCQARQPGH